MSEPSLLVNATPSFIHRLGFFSFPVSLIVKTSLIVIVLFSILFLLFLSLFVTSQRPVTKKSKKLGDLGGGMRSCPSRNVTRAAWRRP